MAVKKITLANGNIQEIDVLAYDTVKQALINFPIKNQWLAYNEIFPKIKQQIVDVAGSDVWYCAAIMQDIATTTELLEKSVDNKYLIK